MLILHVLQQCRYVRPTKVVYGFQTGEEAPIGDPLEVVLADILEWRVVLK